MSEMLTSFESVLYIIADFLCYSDFGKNLLGVTVLAFMAGLFRYICFGKE